MRPDAHTLVAAYAVDALDEEERTEVREHLDQCETCRDDLRSFRETVAVMASAGAEAPPARMRETVLARARATPQLPPVTAAVATGGPVAAVPDRASAAGRLPRSRQAEDGSSRPETAARSGRALFGLAASVLTVAALGAGAFGVVQSDRLGDAREQQAAVQRVLAADDVVSLSAVPQLADGVQGDEVMVLASASEEAVLLFPAGLPAAPEGSTWQAWTVTGGRAVSAGTFDASSGQAVALQASVAGADAVAVTLEPEGGSDSPSTDPVLVMSLA